jgi:mannose-1-phosphate guanylyltransferase
MHVGIDSSGCIIRGEANHLIVTLGLKDCIIVQTADATLVAHRGDEEKLRQVVQELESRKLNQYL